MSTEKDQLSTSLAQNVIILALSVGMLSAVKDWASKGEPQDEARWIDIQVKIPKVLLSGMKIAIESIITVERVKSLCEESINTHCSRFGLKTPESYIFPVVVKDIDPELALQKLLTIFLDEHFVLKLADFVQDNEKYNDTLDLIGATIMRLTEIELKENPDGIRDQTQH